MKIAYATDLHGDVIACEKLLSLGKKVDALVIGGDISPGFGIHEQRLFLKDYLIPMLKEYANNGKPVLLIPGNDDYTINLPLLQAAEKGGFLTLLHNRTIRLGGFHFAGYSFVNDGPLIIRDWVKKEAGIRKDLASLGIRNPGKTVCVFHAPPKGTKLDVIWTGEHVGSSAIREFFLKSQPLLGLHGHIHESRDITGSFTDLLGKTVIINPGNSRAILVDLETLEVEEA